MKRLSLLPLILLLLLPSCALCQDVYYLKRIGKYHVGVDIDPGVYTVTAYSSSSFDAEITVGDRLSLYGDPFGDSPFVRFFVHHPGNPIPLSADAVTSCVVELKDGQELYLHTEPAIFTLISSSSVAPSSTPVSPSDPPYAPGSVFRPFDFDAVVSSPDDYAGEMFVVSGTVLNVSGSRQDGYTLLVAVEDSLAKMIFVRVDPEFVPSFEIHNFDSINALSAFVKMYDFVSDGKPASVPLVMSALITLDSAKDDP